MKYLILINEQDFNLNRFKMKILCFEESNQIIFSD